MTDADQLPAEDSPMDDYQDEILEWHAAQQDYPEPAEDAFEL
ncbi:hypothetical protein [Stutzerimonas nitrititolerans]|nr:hypothetical protein [Stutzerimonas nitrititolerans]